MTLQDLDRRVKVLENEIRLLNVEILRLKGVPVVPGFGPIGTFAEDSSFEEAVRYGRKYRELVNRDEYVDPLGDNGPQKKSKPTGRKKPTSSPRKNNGRP